MKEKELPFRFLVHCNLHQIREGFEANLKSLPITIDIHYANLLQEGIMAELKFSPHLIVILQYESDSDFLLPLKIKSFIPDIPLLIISPSIPQHYHYILESIGVNYIIQLPADDEHICKTIYNILLTLPHGNP